MLARDRGEVLFIVGAGVSYPPPSRLPDFRGLVIDIYADIDTAMVAPLTAVKNKTATWDSPEFGLDDRQKTELKFFSREEYDVTLGMLERRIDGDPKKQSKVRKATHEILSRTREPNALHESLIRLGQRFGRTLLVTTNFDVLLERASKKLKIPSSIFCRGDIPSPSRAIDFHGLLYIHGRLDDELRSGGGIVLTDQDFGDAYLRKHNITQLLYDAARIFHLVLVGYSANDSPVRYLLNAIAADERHFNDLKPRYAFIGCPPGDSRSPLEWEMRGIRPIAYSSQNEHVALAHCLRQWAAVCTSAPSTVDAYRQLKEIAALDPTSSEVQLRKPYVDYLLLRSTASELKDIISIVSKKGSPHWISYINSVLRRKSLHRAGDETA